MSDEENNSRQIIEHDFEHDVSKIKYSFNLRIAENSGFRRAVFTYYIWIDKNVSEDGCPL